MTSHYNNTVKPVTNKNNRTRLMLKSNECII